MGIHSRLKCLVPLLALTACSFARNDGECASGDAALKVTNTIVGKRWSYHLQPPYPKPNLKDDGAIWEVEYGAPDDSVGGGPTFFIDKQTCKVEKIVAEQ